jgi:hypothetical protein
MPHTRNRSNLLATVRSGMKNTIVNRSRVNLVVVALFTLLFAGCAVAPNAENLSVGTTARHMRTGGPAIGEADDLQPDPSVSPKFFQWGDRKNVWD